MSSRYGRLVQRVREEYDEMRKKNRELQKEAFATGQKIGRLALSGWLMIGALSSMYLASKVALTDAEYSQMAKSYAVEEQYAATRAAINNIEPGTNADNMMLTWAEETEGAAIQNYLTHEHHADFQFEKIHGAQKTTDFLKVAIKGEEYLVWGGADGSINAINPDTSLTFKTSNQEDSRSIESVYGMEGSANIIIKQGNQLYKLSAMEDFERDGFHKELFFGSEGIQDVLFMNSKQVAVAVENGFYIIDSENGRLETDLISEPGLTVFAKDYASDRESIVALSGSIRSVYNSSGQLIRRENERRNLLQEYLITKNHNIQVSAYKISIQKPPESLNRTCAVSHAKPEVYSTSRGVVTAVSPPNQLLIHHENGPLSCLRTTIDREEVHKLRSLSDREGNLDLLVALTMDDDGDETYIEAHDPLTSNTISTIKYGFLSEADLWVGRLNGENKIVVYNGSDKVHVFGPGWLEMDELYHLEE